MIASIHSRSFALCLLNLSLFLVFLCELVVCLEWIGLAVGKSCCCRLSSLQHGCNLAHRWPSFSWPEEETHAAVIFSFQCSFEDHAHIYTADHIENVLFFHLNLEITKMVCRLKVLVTFNMFKAPLSSLVYVALADKAFSSNTYWHLVMWM